MEYQRPSSMYYVEELPSTLTQKLGLKPKNYRDSLHPIYEVSRNKRAERIKKYKEQLSLGKDLIQQGVSDGIMAYGALGGGAMLHYTRQKMKQHKADLRALRNEMTAEELVTKWRKGHSGLRDS